MDETRCTGRGSVMDLDRAVVIAGNVHRGVDLLKSCIDAEDFWELKAHVAQLVSTGGISLDDYERDLKMFSAIDVLMEV